MAKSKFFCKWFLWPLCRIDANVGPPLEPLLLKSSPRFKKNHIQNGKILPLFQYNLFSSTELSKIAANVSWTCWGKDSKRCLSFGSDVMLFKPLTRSGLRPPLMVKGGWRLSSEAQIRPYCKSRPTTSSIRGGKALQKRTKAGNTGGNSCWRSSAVSTEKGPRLDRIQRWCTMLHITSGVGRFCRSTLRTKK